MSRTVKDRPGKRQRRAPEVASFAATNFKAFSEDASIPLRPITLLYGENSAGKSSLLQALLLLRQSLDSSREGEPLLESRGPIVNLGPYRELVYRHKVSLPLVFEFQVAPRGVGLHGLGLTSQALPMRFRLVFAHDRKSSRPSLGNIEVRTQDSDKLLLGLRFSSRTDGFRFDGADFSHPAWRALTLDPERTMERRGAEAKSLRERLSRVEATLNDADQSESTVAIRYHLLRQIRDLEQQAADAVREASVATGTEAEWYGRLQGSLALSRVAFLPTGPLRQDRADPAVEVPSLTERTGAIGLWQLTLSLAAELRAFLQGIAYVGPLRDFPDRLYLRQGGTIDEVGASGKYAPELLAAEPELTRDVNEALERFGVGYQVDVALGSGPTHDLRDVFALRLKDSHNRVRVGLADVGFGVSQVLPVVVQSLLSRRRTILIEQPEIHLHPRLQAELGSLFAQAAKPPYENRFVIETHSEHLMLRLQRLIRRGDLRASDVGVVYVRRGRWASIPIELRLDKAGQLLDQWPGGFFEEAYREVFDLDAG